MQNLEYGHWRNIEKSIQKESSITHLADYHGQETLSLAITQLGTTAKYQDQVVKSWCDFFINEKTPIKKILFYTRMSQKIFDSVCQQQQLDGLYIKWGVYPDIQNIQKLQNLKYLHLGGGASITDITVLQNLTKLITLETSNLFKINEYAFLSKLDKLEDLSIEGDRYSAMKKVKLKSLKFLEEMPQIIRLSLDMVSIQDHSYLPILKIKSLRHLDVDTDKDFSRDMHLFRKFIG